MAVQLPRQPGRLARRAGGAAHDRRGHAASPRLRPQARRHADRRARQRAQGPRSSHNVDDISPDYPLGHGEAPHGRQRRVDMPTEADDVIAVAAVGPSRRRPTTRTTASSRTTSRRPAAASETSSVRRSSAPVRHRCSGHTRRAWRSPVGVVDRSPESRWPTFVVCACASAPGNCAYWQYLQGTSMASPHAAGVAALIVSEFGRGQRHGKGRSMDPAKVERILRATATNVACPSPVITYIAEGRDACSTRHASDRGPQLDLRRRHRQHVGGGSAPPLTTFCRVLRARLRRAAQHPVGRTMPTCE